jgi:hypothetical protein
MWWVGLGKRISTPVGEEEDSIAELRDPVVDGVEQGVPGDVAEIL